MNNKIKNIIKDSLFINDNKKEKELISEASLSAQQKKFNINTDFLSHDNLSNHLELYEDYVKKFNNANAKINSSDKSNENYDYRALKTSETFNLNGIYLHELYFSNIGDPNSQIKMDSLSYIKLSRDFGSFDEWQKDFLACCMSSQNGWAITYLNFYTQTYMNAMIDDHTSNMPIGGYPVVVMDTWQHSYYRDYLKDVDTYSKAMMKQFRWDVIEERIKKADKILQVIRGQIQ